MQTCSSFHSKIKRSAPLVHSIPLASTKCNVKRERITLPERKVKTLHQQSSEPSLTKRFLFSTIVILIATFSTAIFLAKAVGIPTRDIPIIMIENFTSHPIAMVEIAIAVTLMNLGYSTGLSLLAILSILLIPDIAQLLIHGHHLFYLPQTQGYIGIDQPF